MIFKITILIMGNYSSDSNKHYSSNQTCSICLESITNVNYSITKCNHMFHTSCLTKWFIIGEHSCPLCRTKLIKKKINNNFRYGGWREYNLGRDIGFVMGLSFGMCCMFIYKFVF